MHEKKMIIAIDGYSSTGKSTFAKSVAKMLGYTYIDTGAMYRAVTLAFMDRGYGDAISGNGDIPENINEILHSTDIDIKTDSSGRNVTMLDGKNVEDRIRMPEVSDRVSDIAALPQVREHITSILRKLGERKCIVMDGRDIGTSVFPDAELKIFMTADIGTRARRRYLEMKEKGIAVTLDEVRENLEKRDEIDTHRKVSPLVKAKDAIVLDNSNMTLNEELEWIKSLLK